jgi:hypothetical protein
VTQLSNHAGVAGQTQGHLRLFADSIPSRPTYKSAFLLRTEQPHKPVHAEKFETAARDELEIAETVRIFACGSVFKEGV